MRQPSSVLGGSMKKFKTFKNFTICKDCLIGFDTDELVADGWDTLMPLPCCNGQMAISTDTEVIVENMCEEDQEVE